MSQPDDLQRNLPAASGRRIRSTRRSVILGDRIAESVIRVGGIGVIAAVLGILVFLTSVVWPLFRGSSVSTAAQLTLPRERRESPPVVARVDEYRGMGVMLERDGTLETFDARRGDKLSRRSLFPAEFHGTVSAALPDGSFAVGDRHGQLLTGRLDFSTSYLRTDQVPKPARPLAPGDTISLDGSVIERTTQGEWKRLDLDAQLNDPISNGDAPIELIDLRRDEGVLRVAVLSGESIALFDLETSEEFASGEKRLTVSRFAFTLPPERPHGQPTFLLQTGRGDQLYAAWRQGTVLRWDLKDRNAPQLVERAELLADPHSALSALQLMNGDQSILACDDRGALQAWSRVELGGNSGKFALARTHEFPAMSAACSVFGIPQRDKSFAVGDVAGGIALLHLTSEKLLVSVTPSKPEPIVALQITPKGDGLFSLADSGRGMLFDLANPHPETSWRSLFGSVWYEGYPKPSFTWQSSAATDDFEPKLSLIPLIFGTLKATLYAMFFAVPLAICAAIYTAEFMERKTRSWVKPTIELMAALPSVVLGFIAALVLAPFIERSIVGILVALIGVPVVALGTGYLWQALPSRISLPLERGWRTGSMIVVVLLAALFFIACSRPFEQILFAGDFKAWLERRQGTALPGLLLLIWPLVFVAVQFASRRFLDRKVATIQRSFGRRRAATVELGSFLGQTLLATLFAFGLAALLSRLGVDPRAFWLGTYVQGNALIVGFTMGFAVIPIIYTIAEDALSVVPISLRSASLGCGATRWQTAIRVVLPVAMPGIFSALMVGLGRAIGETMIVLMAAGNTAIIDLNPFNGLRTLSANIAVELPEAVKEGTLYRTLFLTALVLFLFTFVVNTVAESVRIRFRRRTAAV